ncbi:TPA: type IV secretion system protein [Campylobacter fetus subsp. venerealis]|nr:type IV secretion system protein [Campylobacter fetus subsp. venerealis]HDX6254653.1 type IV secretion system protein [Campylobacter fetus subsp. venerealis]HDX6258529.1 type IV secretion system protein [Campylobacter fetus subsp. venerealis]HDX6262432.1 type IV secretion system protein [Campylobacter fetus subsp. venerealis]HDX6264454.1 type IV secretion system protein [Campylobacter fetus subsp. venerealis]
MAQQQVSKELLTDSNWINKIQAIMQENVMSLFEKFYNGAHDLVYSTASQTIIILIVVFWLLGRLKNGYPTREETFGAIKYIIMLCFIFATLSSFNAYMGVLYLLTIPENVITAIVSSIFQNKDFGSIITESANRVDNLRALMWNYGTTEYLKTQAWSFLGISFNGVMDYLGAGIITALSMIPFWIFYAVFFILLIGITIVIFFSKFMAFLILSTLPLVIPFLLMPKFLPYLWSWYKLYLSYAIIAPLAFIALNLAINPILELEKYQNYISELFVKQFEYLITGSITCISALFLLKKIPSWINAVLGTQMESGSGGVVGGVVAGAVASKTLLGGLARKATGGSFVGGALSSLGAASGANVAGQIASASIGAGANVAKDIGRGIGKTYEAYKKFKGGYVAP